MKRFSQPRHTAGDLLGKHNLQENQRKMYVSTKFDDHIIYVFCGMSDCARINRIRV